MRLLDVMFVESARDRGAGVPGFPPSDPASGQSLSDLYLRRKTAG